MSETDIVRCFECGEELQDHEAMYHIGSDQFVCEECRNNSYMYCDDCDELAREDHIVAVDRIFGGRYVCWDCADDYHTCDECRELYSYDRIAVDIYNITLCADCYEDHYFACEGCREIHYLEDSEQIDGDLYCRSCANDRRDSIQSYSYRPDPVFYGGNAGYGVELEIDDGEDRENAARYIRAAGRDHIYVKEDGSLSYDGMEIVTHPATLEYHVNHFPWSEICEVAESYGYRSHDTNTCGLHIHASRSLFGSHQMEQDLTIAKIILLVDRWYDSYIVRFARRDLSRMRRWADKPNAGIAPEDDNRAAVDKSKKTATDRYKAVNLCNRHTVEFRFFRGTLKRDTIIASIQWVDTIINYCKATPLKDLFDATWDDIFGNTGYEELTNYLKQRGLYNPTLFTVKEED